MATTLGTDISALSLSSPMKRKGYGTIGKRYSVLVNTFKVKPPSMTCYQYDLKIGPEDTKRPARLNRQIWKYWVSTQNPFEGIACVYDGKAQVFAPKKLSANEGKWVLRLPESDGRDSKGNQFTIAIKFVRPVHLDALGAFVSGQQKSVDEGVLESAIQALNVVIQHGPMLAFQSRGASFFMPNDDPNFGVISKGLTMWRGFYSSMRCGVGNNYILLDLASQPMYTEGDLWKLLVSYGRARDRKFGPNSLATNAMPGTFAIEVTRFIRSLRITINFGPNAKPMHRKIVEMTRTSANDSEFQTDDGKTTNVARYFAEHHRIRLQHPEWPCIKVSKVALYPLELCSVHGGQKFSKKLDPTQTAESLKLTTIGPRDRVPLLRRGIERIMPSNAASPLNQWGLEFSKDPMTVQARVLPPPTVQMKKPVVPRDGVYDLRGQQFVRPCPPIERWTVFVLDKPNFFRKEEVQKSVEDFARGLQAVGIQVKNMRPAITYVPHMAPSQLPTFFRETVKGLGMGGPPQLLLCYLARKPCEEYAVIKRFGDLDVGVATQCLAVPKAKRGNPQYYASVALKVNVKLNGMNSTVNLGPAMAGAGNVPTIIVGADVTHPAPGSVAPSVAAVVATMNKEFTNYASRIHIQGSRVEIISGLEAMMMDLLRQFKATNNVAPQRIIFYRDGVSEGQFAQVMNGEISQIKSACRKISPEYKPKVTFLVVGKRHHLSIFPKNEQDGDRTGNVKAGTCIDTDITSPFEQDFYLQSHASLLGTSRSAHYNVLMDENNLSVDAIQQLTYNLTYTYARASRSVSYSTPAYYADRLCTRAALYLGTEAEDSMSSVSGVSEERQREQLLADYRGRLKPIHANHKQSLFFM